jgi:3-oxoacyl-(acyl-carrier-protein) synthase
MADTVAADLSEIEHRIRKVIAAQLCVEEANAMRLELQEAGMSVEAVDYISAHGTGTPINDL